MRGILFFAILPSLAPTAADDPVAYGKTIQEVTGNLQRDVLDVWIPRSLDVKRGFHENYSRTWQKLPGDDRSLVYQARMVWVASKAAQRFPADKKRYLAFADHGAAFLRTAMWDAKHGGLYWSIDGKDQPFPMKHAYGIAFGIYALAAHYEATGDRRSLDLAKKAFRWLDDHAHDDVNGGYIECMTLDGTPMIGPDDREPKRQFVRSRMMSPIGVVAGDKAMNTHIHLLESFTELARVWPDARLKKRLAEVYDCLASKVYHRDGFFGGEFHADWKQLPGNDSYGHDIETGFLIVEAAKPAGRSVEEAWKIARQVIDHTVAVGMDREHGGLFERGSAVTGPTDEEGKVKTWWVQAEALNALLLAHERYRSETPKYGEEFMKLWRFIADYQTDAKNGGWHPALDSEGKPFPWEMKSNGWTEAYHQGRALMLILDRLRSLSSAK